MAPLPVFRHANLTVLDCMRAKCSRNLPAAQGSLITPRTQKAISSLKEQLWGGEKGDQDGEGSPVDCRSWPVAASNRASRAVCRLSREFDLSEHQAYRYLQEAAQLGGPIEVPEATVPITLKLPPRTVELLRKYARSSGLTIGAIVASALSAFLRALKRHG